MSFKCYQLQAYVYSPCIFNNGFFLPRLDELIPAATPLEFSPLPNPSLSKMPHKSKLKIFPPIFEKSWLIFKLHITLAANFNHLACIVICVAYPCNYTRVLLSACNIKRLTKATISIALKTKCWPKSVGIEVRERKIEMEMPGK